MCSIQQFATKRRNLLLTMFLASVSLPLVATDASADTELEESFQTYKDEVNKFRMSIPKDWLIGTGDSDGNSLKSVTAFYPNEASGSNGLGPDFTRLQSFGNVDAFAETLVSGLDRSWRNPPGVAAKLIDSKAANGLYYIEYTLQIPGEKRRHILTALGVASNGWYNRLYTVTGQYMEDEAEKYQPSIAKIHMSNGILIRRLSTATPTIPPQPDCFFTHLILYPFPLRNLTYEMRISADKAMAA
ncbi:hypothetical protein ZIOFF_058424 [Zingiber officinale]|uniref:PsbP C-terminal domain-containing protein n=1 Tax=Zingiber officinale TaxID=94328 RepID=A0A8J5KM00_ZINOF|nr:hypothetical protein ZIOFF_058424 [Zingiber officinale]